MADKSVLLSYVENANDDELAKVDVLCFGHFNVIHPGHLRFLKFASTKGNELAILLKSDTDFKKSERPHFFTEDERKNSLLNLRLVSQVFSKGNLSLEECIKAIDPKYLVLGNEFQNNISSEFSEAIKTLESKGGNVIFHSGEKDVETNYLDVDFKGLNSEKRLQFGNVCKRRQITRERIIQITNEFKNQKILVLGDLIVDEFRSCEPLGLSSEAPVVVVKELGSTTYTGGAGIVAAHIASLGGKSHLLSVCGNDDVGVGASEDLDEKNVIHDLIIDSSRPTTFKTRFIVGTQKLFRVSRLSDHDIPSNIEDKIIAKLEQHMPSANGLIVSDFVYGVVTKNILKKIETLAKNHNVKLFGDLQCSSQLGSVLKFRNFDLILPTEKEARLAIENKDDSLEFVAQELLEKSHCKSLVITLNSQGSIVYKKLKNGHVEKEHFPALSSNAVDVSGAGDSMLSAMALSMCAGADPIEANLIGSIVSSSAVEILGNQPIIKSSLLEKIHSFMS